MFLMLAKYKAILLSCLLVTFIAGAYYGFHYLMQHQREVGYNEAVAQYKTQALIAEVEARRKENQFVKQVQEAQDAANLREQTIKKLSDDLTVTNRKLRDTTATLRSKLSTDSLDAVRKTADAALTVFGECQERYTAMGENATGHANDVVTLSDAWPK